MAINSQMPRTAAATKPAIPMTDTPKRMGGTLELMTTADPRIRAAIIMEKEIRLLVWSWLFNSLSRLSILMLKDSFPDLARRMISMASPGKA